MFKKIMSKLGVGGAKVDLVLHKHDYKLGETLTADLIVQGGTVTQHINQITVELMMNLRVKDKTYSRTVQTFPVSQAFDIAENERVEFPLTFELPNDMLLSSRTISYHFITDLDIAQAADHQDHDPVMVMPPKRLNQVLDAFGALGFHESANSREFDGYAQAFEFSPTTKYREQMKTVEFVAALDPNVIRLWLEVDLYGMREKGYDIRQEVVLRNDMLSDHEALVSKLDQVIGEMIAHPNAYMHERPMLRSGQMPVSKFGGFKGAIGGMAVGLLGGFVLSEMMENMMDSDLVGNAVDGVSDRIDGMEDTFRDVQDSAKDAFDGGGDDWF